MDFHNIDTIGITPEADFEMLRNQKTKNPGLLGLRIHKESSSLFFLWRDEKIKRVPRDQRVLVQIIAKEKENYVHNIFGDCHWYEPKEDYHCIRLGFEQIEFSFGRLDLHYCIDKVEFI